jgi:hypothetical protein
MVSGGIVPIRLAPDKAKDLRWCKRRPVKSAARDLRRGTALGTGPDDLWRSMRVGDDSWLSPLVVIDPGRNRD